MGGKEIKANENSGGKLEEEYSCVFCQKKTCIYCQKEAHIGFSCLELSDAAQPARLSVEEVRIFFEYFFLLSVSYFVSSLSSGSPKQKFENVPIFGVDCLSLKVLGVIE